MKMNLNPKKSFRVGIFCYILLGALLPALTILAIFSRYLTANIHTELVNHVERMQKVAATDVAQLITKFKSNLAEQSKSDFVAALLGANENVTESLQRLASHLKQTSQVEFAALYKINGLRLAATDLHPHETNLSLEFLDKIEAKKEEDVPVFIKISTQQEVGFRIDAYSPVTEPFYKYLMGILHEYIFIDRQFISDLKNKTGLEVALFISKESFIYTTATMPVLDAATYRTLRETKDVTTQNSLDIENVIYHTVLIPLLDENGTLRGSIGLMGSEEIIEQGKLFIQKISLIALLSIIFLSFLISHTSTRRVIKPIMEVVDSLRKTATGDLSQRIEVKSQNEIGELADSFNKMTEDLQHSSKALITMKDYTDNILRSMVETLIVILPNGIIRTVNQATIDLLGYTEGEMKGKPLQDIISGENIGSEHFKEDLKVGAVSNFELAYKTHSGEEILMLFSGSAMKRKTGEIEGIVCIARDITARKEAEEELRKLSRAIEQSPSLLMITNTMGAIEYVNPIFSKTTGYTLEEVVGKNPRILKSGLVPQASYKILWHTILSGIEWRGELRNKKKSGELYWESTSISPIRNQQGDITHFLSVAEDITKRKQAEAALGESEERFRQIFEQNEDAIMIFKAGTAEILDVNPAAIDLYGYTREELVERGPSLFIDPEGRLNFTKELINIDTDVGLWIEQQEHTQKDGGSIIIEIRGKRIRLRQSQVSYCIFHNITEKIHMEKEAKRIQGQLIHANKMTSLGAMVSGVAHEINNPNNVMMFNAPLIADAWRDALPVLIEYYQTHGEFSLGGLPFQEMRTLLPKLASGISDSSHRIKNIVDNLKNFARQDHLGMDNIIRVNEVTQAAIDLISNQIEDNTQHFSLHCGQDLPLMKGNAQQLEQVMINLIINALQALPDETYGVSVSTALGKNGDTIIIKVSDEGCGMDESVIERIMEPFYTTRIDSGGTGLGLSISYAIVKEHQGTIEYQSRIGKGTTVVVTLPVDK